MSSMRVGLKSMRRRDAPESAETTETTGTTETTRTTARYGYAAAGGDRGDPSTGDFLILSNRVLRFGVIPVTVERKEVLWRTISRSMSRYCGGGCRT